MTQVAPLLSSITAFPSATISEYLLEEYRLSPIEALQSLIVSEYALRHLAMATIQPQYKWEHRLIALIEFVPGLGWIVSIIELLLFRYYSSPIPLLFQGTQFRDPEAPIDRDRLKATIDKLQQHRNKSANISFNAQETIDKLEGGTCSAMSLYFIHKYLEAKRKAASPSEEVATTLLASISKLRGLFAYSSETFRDQQAAYDTIQIVDQTSQEDHSKNKIQALLNDYDVSIQYASQEIDVRARGAFETLISQLKEGVYFVRILKPDQNPKLEAHGHSLVYIKEHGLRVFYDPNKGACNLAQFKESNALFNLLYDCFESFQVSQLRFYQVS